MPLPGPWSARAGRRSARGVRHGAAPVASHRPTTGVGTGGGAALAAAPQWIPRAGARRPAPAVSAAGHARLHGRRRPLAAERRLRDRTHPERGPPTLRRLRSTCCPRAGHEPVVGIRGRRRRRPRDGADASEPGPTRPPGGIPARARGSLGFDSSGGAPGPRERGQRRRYPGRAVSGRRGHDQHHHSRGSRCHRRRPVRGRGHGLRGAAGACPRLS